MREESRSLLVEGARALGVELEEGMIASFDRHRALLEEWGRAVSLTAIRGEREIVLKHFLDSLSVVPYLPERTRIVDLGSGAGFPGIPVKIVRPSLEVCLLESNGRKAAFLKAVVRAIGAQGIEVVGSRSEEASREPRLAGSFDVALSRAFGPIDKAARAAHGLVRSEGQLIAMLGSSAPGTGRETPGGWALDREIPLRLPTGAGRRLLVFYSRKP